MSDDRFTRDDDPLTPDRTYIDRKPYRPSSGTPTKFNLAEECDKFLEAFCDRFGVARRDSKPGKKGNK